MADVMKVFNSLSGISMVNHPGREIRELEKISIRIQEKG
jgi:hypothetical protein